MSVKQYKMTGKPYARREYMKKYYADNKEHRKKMYRLWYLKNKEYRHQYLRKMRPKYKEWRDKYNKKYRAEHLDELREKARLWRLPIRDKLNAACKEYYRKTYPLKRERLIKQTKEYRKAHPELRHKCYLNWKKKHPEYNTIKSAQRRAAIKALPMDLAVSGIISKAKNRKKFVCYYCGKKFPRKDMHIDHIVPVSKRGGHTSDNICVSCKTCNLCKNAKPIEKLEFIQQRLLPM